MKESYDNEYFETVKRKMDDLIKTFRDEEKKSGFKMYDFEKLKLACISGHMSALESIAEQKGEALTQVELLKYEYHLRKALGVE